MKKPLAALVVMGSLAGTAHAQSNVIIYGVMDTGYVKTTGYDAVMDENALSRLGFRGVEDLGSGRSVFFNLEERFRINSGTKTPSPGGPTDVDKMNAHRVYDGVANVGLAGDWGKLSLGRVFNVSTWYYQTLDPFRHDGVGRSLFSSQRQRSVSNTLRYDSPETGSLRGSASFTRSGVRSGYDIPDGDSFKNDGYAAQVQYSTPGIMLFGGFERVADSSNSIAWNVGAGYEYHTATITMGYIHTRDKAWSGGGYSYGHNGSQYIGTWGDRQDQVIVGLVWKLGPGKLNASWNHGRYRAEGLDSESVNKLALGYTYNLSRRFALYADTAYARFSEKFLAGAMTGRGPDSSRNYFMYQAGMTYRF